MASAPLPPFPAPPRPLTRKERRALRYATRRKSVIGPLLLVGLGVVALLLETGRVRWDTALNWYGQWWPLLLIAAGILLAVEWSVDRARHQQEIAAGAAVYGPRRVGGGVIWLLVLLALAGSAVHASRSVLLANHPHGLDFLNFDMLHAVGQAYEADETFEQAVVEGGSLNIDNPQGDVLVSGTSTDGQIHVSIHKRVYAYDQGDATGREGSLHPVMQDHSGYVTMRVPYVDGGQADLTVSVPASVSLTATTGPGQVRVSGLHGAVTVNGNRGDVDLSDLTGTVIAHMHSDGATLSAHALAGSLMVDGHTGDLNISDIRGAVTLDGNFFGTSHFEKLDGPMTYHTSRTDLQIARLPGELEFDTGDSMQGDQLVGPVMLKTRDRVISFDRVQGDVSVANTNGAVTLTGGAPLGTIRVDNKRGSVDVGVPANTNFMVFAATKHGAIEDDFGFKREGSNDAPEVSGAVGQGGPTIHIETSDGDVTLRKSSASAPTPPTPPAPPALLSPPPAPPPPAPHQAKRR